MKVCAPGQLRVLAVRSAQSEGIMPTACHVSCLPVARVSATCIGHLPILTRPLIALTPGPLLVLLQSWLSGRAPGPRPHNPLC
eukprot:1179628-Alexandrium_andersonii.AAC.1